MKNYFSLLIVLMLTFPQGVLAGNADECRNRINAELATEQRLYRAYLFGKPKAADAPAGDVRYDNENRAWVKTGSDSVPWVTSAPTFRSTSWSNTLMDQFDEHSSVLPLKGIFETKRVLTSELIPYLLRSIRALECRTLAVCEVAKMSETREGEGSQFLPVVQPIGCIKFTDKGSLPECHFAGEQVLAQADIRTYCTDVASQLLEREAALLKLAVEYDAGYRSLLQFAGNFDIFLREIRWPLTGTLRQAVQLIGQLGRIPCFLSSCDAAPPE